MKVLLDTHTFIWALLQDYRLSAKLKQILTSDESELYFSLASLWEISITIRLGKLNAIGSSVAYIDDTDRFLLALSQVAGKRLTFAELTGKNERPSA